MVIEPIPDYGDHMKIEDFIEAVKAGAFIDYDGFGCYAMEDYTTDLIIKPSDVMIGTLNKNFTHVVWYNR
jgi:hypothetical protein